MIHGSRTNRNLMLYAAGRCELCKTKFRFDPRYAENTPDRLPVHEVFLGLSNRILAKWLPFALRVLTAATLWLVVAPLLTSSLYHGWMHRPSSIPSRWSRDLIPGDIVSGAIIAAIVIISFLSLMSFADFLRVQLQHPERAEDAQRRRNGNDWVEDGHIDSDVDGGIDERIYDFLYLNHTLSSSKGSSTQQVEGTRHPLETTIRGALERAAAENAETDSHPDYDSDADSEYNPDADSDEEEEGDPDELDEEFVDERVEGIGIDLDDPRPQNDVAPNNNRPFDPLDPALQDDQVVSATWFLCIVATPAFLIIRISLSRRIWKSMWHWMNCLGCEDLQARLYETCCGFWHSMLRILVSLRFFQKQWGLLYMQEYSTPRHSTRFTKVFHSFI